MESNLSKLDEKTLIIPSIIATENFQHLKEYLKYNRDLKITDL